MRRQALGGGHGGSRSRQVDPRHRCSTARWARSTRAANCCSRRARGVSACSRARGGRAAPPTRGRFRRRIVSQVMFPGGMAWAAGAAGAEPAADRHGRRRRPALAQASSRAGSTRSSTRPTSSRRRSAACRCACRARSRGRAGLLHRRDQRADRRARPRAHSPGTHGSPHLVPHADEGRPQGHLRALHQRRSPTSPSSTPTSAATRWRASPTATRRR